MAIPNDMGLVGLPNPRPGAYHSNYMDDTYTPYGNQMDTMGVGGRAAGIPHLQLLPMLQEIIQRLQARSRPPLFGPPPGQMEGHLNNPFEVGHPMPGQMRGHLPMPGHELSASPIAEMAGMAPVAGALQRQQAVSPIQTLLERTRSSRPNNLEAIRNRFARNMLARGRERA